MSSLNPAIHAMLCPGVAWKAASQLERAATIRVAGWCQSNTQVEAQSRTAQAEYTRECSTDAWAAQ